MRVLDLYCCAGGAARGYQLAGASVHGVDVVPRPRYCGEAFSQMDAIFALLEVRSAGDLAGSGRPDLRAVALMVLGVAVLLVLVAVALLLMP